MSRSLFLLIAISSAQAQVVPFSCGVGHATSEQLQELSALVTADSSILASSDEVITVPVCSYIFKGRHNDDEITDQMLQDQLDYLNQGFTAASCCDVADVWCNPVDCSVETNIQFAWAVVTPKGTLAEGHTTPNIQDEGACSFRLFRPLWLRTNSVNGFFMKRLLRKGGPNVLNIYWSNPLGSIAYATFPTSSKRKHDGVVINPAAVTGGDLPGYGRGATLIHEVGHWMGLLHTFQGSCESSDGIDDTPMEYAPFRGCGELPGYPLDRDSCPDNPGTDPVHNFMDYSGDLCWYKFTAGQMAVMRASWFKYRAINTIVLQEGQPSEAITLVARGRQLYSLITSNAVRCTASATEGDIGLYLQWRHEPRYIAFPLLNTCSTHGRPDQSCTVRRPPRQQEVLYIGVKSSFVPVTDLVVTCVAV